MAKGRKIRQERESLMESIPYPLTEVKNQKDQALWPLRTHRNLYSTFSQRYKTAFFSWKIQLDRFKERKKDRKKRTGSPSSPSNRSISLSSTSSSHSSSWSTMLASSEDMRRSDKRKRREKHSKIYKKKKKGKGGRVSSNVWPYLR